MNRSEIAGLVSVLVCSILRFSCWVCVRELGLLWSVCCFVFLFVFVFRLSFDAFGDYLTKKIPSRMSLICILYAKRIVIKKGTGI